jgi:hypothetical protein
MKNGKLLDLYSDYLISAFGQTTATGLFSLLDGEVSHDQIQRFLASEEETRRICGGLSNHICAKLKAKTGLSSWMIVSPRNHTENDIICWHYDHSQQRTVKGINFVTCLYHSQGISLPVGFELVGKTERYTDPEDGKEKRRADKTKN